MKREIYLKQAKINVGCGSTAKKAAIEDYYEVVEVDEDHVKVVLLDMSDQPFGKASLIPKGELKGYIPCPDYFKNKKTSRELTVEKHVQSGDQHYVKKEYPSADDEYNRALALDEDHLKANLGKGKTLFAQGEKEAALKIFSKLSQMDSLFDVENKHVFNEFGIELRKRGLFEEAISNYLKAIALDPTDEILHYNLGRGYYEREDYGKAITELGVALKIKPDFLEAEEFLKKIQCY